MDEFLVDGETIVRNLESGLARAAELGGAMRVGYLPDMFGHVAQMPQILRSAGIETTVVWRGVPSAVDFHRFVWEAPDGSAVVAEYLPGGYGNAAHVQDPEVLEERYGPWFRGDEILGMVGTDHMPLVRDLPAGVRVGTLTEYLAEPTLQHSVTTWRGEMRSAARANLLPGVVSARIDLKAACSRAERWLERYAEPLQTLYGEDEPEPFLREAWKRMFQNAAHDSICGCSADEVSAQVLVRYAEAEQIARELTQRAVQVIAEQTPRGAFAVVNPSPRERTDLVELELVVPDEWEAVGLELPDGSQVPTQELNRQDPVLWESEARRTERPQACSRAVCTAASSSAATSTATGSRRAERCSRSATSRIPSGSTSISSWKTSRSRRPRALGRSASSRDRSAPSSPPSRHRRSGGRVVRPVRRYRETK